MITFVYAICTGADDWRLEAQIGGNLRLGRTPRQLLDTTILLFPFAGYVRVTNAMKLVGKVAYKDA